MTTWAQWREAAKTPFKDGERVRMEDGKAYKARVPAQLLTTRPATSPARQPRSRP